MLLAQLGRQLNYRGGFSKVTPTVGLSDSVSAWYDMEGTGAVNYFMRKHLTPGGLLLCHFSVSVIFFSLSLSFSYTVVGLLACELLRASEVRVKSKWLLH